MPFVSRIIRSPRLARVPAADALRCIPFPCETLIICEACREWNAVVGAPHVGFTCGTLAGMNLGVGAGCPTRRVYAPFASRMTLRDVWDSCGDEFGCITQFTSSHNPEQWSWAGALQTIRHGYS